jgi:hypothetical protein
MSSWTRGQTAISEEESEAEECRVQTNVGYVFANTFDIM